MKTSKQFNLTTCKVVRTAMATLVVIVTLSLIAIACKDSAEPETPVAYADFGGTQIPIYAGVGISNETAAAKKADIESAYGMILNAGDQTIIKGKVQKIVIVAGGAPNCSYAGGTVNLGQECTVGDIRGFLTGVVLTAHAIDNSRDIIRITFATQTQRSI